MPIIQRGRHLRRPLSTHYRRLCRRLSGSVSRPALVGAEQARQFKQVLAAYCIAGLPCGFVCNPNEQRPALRPIKLIGPGLMGRGLGRKDRGRGRVMTKAKSNRGLLRVHIVPTYNNADRKLVPVMRNMVGPHLSLMVTESSHPFHHKAPCHDERAKK